MVPFGLCIARQNTASAASWWAYTAGAIYYLHAFDFIRTAQLQDTSTILFGPLSIIWQIVAMVAAVQWPLALACGRTIRSVSGAPIFIVLPLSWMLAELFQTFLFALLFGTFFPWFQLGLTQIHFPTISQIADIGGVPLITVVILLFNGILADVIIAWRRSLPLPKRSLCTVCGLIALAALYGRWRMIQRGFEFPGPIVALMPNRLDALTGRRHSLATGFADFCLAAGVTSIKDYANGAPPSLLLWGEDAYRRRVIWPSPADPSTRHAGPSVSDSQDLSTLGHLAARLKADLAIGSLRMVRSANRACWHNSILLISGDGFLKGAIDKTHLVPFYEYAPPLFRPLMPILASWFGCFREYRYTESDSTVKRVSFSGLPSPQQCQFGIAVCNDTCFPSLFRRMCRDGPAPPTAFLIGSYEDEDRRLRSQEMLLTMARFRAIECRRSVCRAAIGGYSSIIDSNGRIRAICADPVSNPSALVAPVPIDNRTSLYVWIGDWVYVVACVAAITGAAIHGPRPTSRVLIAFLNVEWPSWLRRRGH